MQTHPNSQSSSDATVKKGKRAQDVVLKSADLLFYLINYLELGDVLTTSRINKKLNAFVKVDSIWRGLFQQYFPLTYAKIIKPNNERWLKNFNHEVDDFHQELIVNKKRESSYNTSDRYWYLAFRMMKKLRTPPSLLTHQKEAFSLMEKGDLEGFKKYFDQRISNVHIPQNTSIKIKLTPENLFEWRDSSDLTPVSYAQLNDQQDFLDYFYEYIIKPHYLKHALDLRGHTLLHWAIFCRKTAAAVELINASCGVNVATKYGETPLMLAAEDGQIEVMDHLIQNGAKVGKHNKENGMTALFFAIKNGHKKACDILLENKANVSTALEKSAYSLEKLDTPLHAAAQNGDLEIIATLIAQGADVNALNDDEQTPLGYAAKNGHVEAAKLLIANGAALEMHKHVGAPLHVATKYGRKDVVALLLANKVNVNVPTKNKMTPLMYAARSGQVEVVEKLIEKGAEIDFQNKNGLTALYFACKYGHKEVVDLLLSHHAVIDSNQLMSIWQSEDEEIIPTAADTPLHIAAEKGHTEIVKVLLIANRLLVNLRDSKNRTPFMCAINNKQIKTAEFLISNGADVNADNHGETALSLAARQRDTETAQFLISKHANGNCGTKDGWTPLKCAIRDNDIPLVKLILEEDCIRRSEKNNDSIPQSKINNYLIYAIYTGRLEIIKLLLQHGADVNYCDPDSGLNPLLIAVREKNNARKGDLETVKLLHQKYKYGFIAKDQEQQTPIDVADESIQLELKLINFITELQDKINRSNPHTQTESYAQEFLKKKSNHSLFQFGPTDEECLAAAVFLSDVVFEGKKLWDICLYERALNHGKLKPIYQGFLQRWKEIDLLQPDAEKKYRDAVDSIFGLLG